MEERGRKEQMKEREFWSVDYGRRKRRRVATGGGEEMWLAADAGDW